MAAKTTAAELRGLDAEALETKLREAKEELFNLRFQNARASSTTPLASRPSVATSPASTRC